MSILHVETVWPKIPDVTERFIIEKFNVPFVSAYVKCCMLKKNKKIIITLLLIMKSL